MTTSAFYDIWIGKQAPGKYRVNHNEWAQKGEYWESRADKDKSALTEVSTDTHLMIILGQFYETVDEYSLLQDCVNYSLGTFTSFNDPAGHYIIFLIDKIKGNKYVFTNRFGTYHAYWCASAGTCAISTYYLGLAKQATNKKLDWEGITGFLAMGFFPEDKTYLNDIKIFSPASFYAFDHNTELIGHKRYWNWTSNISYQPGRAYVEKIKETLADTLTHATAGKKAAMPVSGGLDSRLLAGALKDLEQDAWSYSYGYSKNSAETRIGEKISSVLGFPFNKFTVSNYLFDKMDIISDSVELFQYVDGTRQACILEPLGQHGDVVIGGHWGDVWMNDSHVENGNHSQELNEFFQKKIIKKGSDWLIEEVCKPNVKSANNFLNDYFATNVGKYKHLGNAELIAKAYKTDQWSFRWTLASVRMYQPSAFPVLPFYDKRIAELLFAMPPAILKDRKFEIEYIKAHYPKLAAITWQEYGRDLYNYKRFNNRNYIYRVVSKMKRATAGKTIMRNWEIFYLNADGRSKLEEILKAPELKEIIPANKIDEIIARFYNDPSGANGYTISMLHTFARFLNQLYS